MATKKSPKTSVAKKGTSKRELISPHGDKRLIRRDAHGRIKESDDLGKSLSRDVKQKAKTTVKSGQGDRGDQKRSAGSALTQHVSTRRTPDGKAVRVVLTPISSGSLKRDRVERAVSEFWSKRELISPNGDKRLIRRDAHGRIKESDDRGKSLAQDVKKRKK